MKAQRLWIVVTVLGLATGVILSRAVQLMVFQHLTWDKLASRQHRRELTVPGQRGEIRSADGYLLATSVERVAIQVDTGNLSYPALFARAAAPWLVAEGESEELRAALLATKLQSTRRMVWLKQRASKATGRAVRALAPAAVVLVPDSQRQYPLGQVAAPVLGFVGREELTTVGRSGLEYHWDATLAGKPARYMAVHDAIERQLRLEQLLPGRAGFDLELTLHARLQAEVERVLGETLAAFDAKAGSAVILEASSGAVRALASLPSFSPEAPGKSPERWRLHPVQDALEPGSTIKPLVAAAALAAGVVDEQERFECSGGGSWVGRTWMRDHAKSGFYNLAEILAVSSNSGIITVAERLDRNLLWQTLDGFGFGRRSGIPLPAESRGILAPVKRWTSLSRASLALGQELTVSPLQLALAYAAIANGGWLPRPHLVNRASAGAGTSTGAPQWRTRVMDQALSTRLCEMLETVVTAGTGSAAGVPGFRVAGKTGTAQRPVAGRYDDQHHVAWFAGFLPLPDPEIVIVVAIDEPRNDFWATTVAAPAFSQIAAAAIRLLHIPASHPLPREGDQA